MQGRDDFVSRLRIRWDAMGDMANDERGAAATEIELLRESQREMMRTIATLRTERDDARNIALAYAAQDIVSNSSMGGTHESWRRLIAHRLRWEMPNESPETIGQKGT